MKAVLIPLVFLFASDALVDRQQERDRMVDRQIVARGVKDERVVRAMREVPRHWFVPDAESAHAYEDRALPIGFEQTISQPYIVAAMTENAAPRPGQKILEIGTGSGYQAAVLSHAVGARGKVFSIEIVPGLADRARSTLKAHGYENVTVIAGDGYRGLPKEAPFDAILVTAAPEHVPQPLIDQLKVGGLMVIPVGAYDQNLKVLEKTKEGLRTRTIFEVRFVPMTGEAQRKE